MYKLSKYLLCSWLIYLYNCEQTRGEILYQHEHLMVQIANASVNVAKCVTYGRQVKSSSRSDFI